MQKKKLFKNRTTRAINALIKTLKISDSYVDDVLCSKVTILEIVNMHINGGIFGFVCKSYVLYNHQA